jgi:hypothetical protein
LLEGVNDIGFSATAGQIISADQQVIAQAHARGLRIYGATITPFGGSIIEAPGREQTRVDVNHWVMTSHAFDGVIDFAAAVADPANPSALLPAYDSGDHLHPNDAGCQAMAEAVNLSMLIGREPACPRPALPSVSSMSKGAVAKASARNSKPKSKNRQGDIALLERALPAELLMMFPGRNRARLGRRGFPSGFMELSPGTVG